ncbi:MAG: nucleotide exchange factor GrpE [Thaumarchaeota archaeon]|nr:nucleotide exchange factor GrpE [Nitrososphaerota archaeon]
MSSRAKKEEVDNPEVLDESSDKSGEVEELKRQLEQEKLKVEATMSKMKYLQADFDNYQKRMNREVEQLLRIGGERIILGLLDIFDNLERAIEAHDKKTGTTGVFDGILMIRNEVKELLDREGIKEIETLGKKFDPVFHEAVSFREMSDLEEGSIISEARKGYLLHEKVVRTSMVEVARKVRIVDVDESEVHVD